jgi:hypothetical protein
MRDFKYFYTMIYIAVVITLILGFQIYDIYKHGG